MNWLLCIISLIAFALLFISLWRRIDKAAWAADEYAEFCYQLQCWIADGEQGMGWANCIYKHQFGLCWNWEHYVRDKYVCPEKIRYLLNYQAKTLFKGRAYPFDNRFVISREANLYVNNKRRLAHIREHARRFAS